MDDATDEVLLYAGAATRTAGSVAATSTFSLDGDNTSPSGVATDGATLCPECGCAWRLSNEPVEDGASTNNVPS